LKKIHAVTIRAEFGIKSSNNCLISPGKLWINTFVYMVVCFVRLTMPKDLLMIFLVLDYLSQWLSAIYDGLTSTLSPRF